MVFQNYMVFAHKNPEQLARLVNALDSENSWFFIHIDKATDQTSFEMVLKKCSRVSFLRNEDRFNTLWGHMNMVKATLRAIDYVINANRGGVGILLSGLDYPVKSKNHIATFLSENKEKCMISAEPLMKGEGVEDIYTTRLNYYRIELADNYICFPSIFNRDFYRKRRVHDLYRVIRYGRLRSLGKLFSLRRHPSNIIPYWGSQWWVLPLDALKQIQLFVKRNRDFLDYHEDTLLPDEIFFQTVLKNLPGSDQGQLLFSDRCTYMIWETGAASPNFLGKDDVETLMALPEQYLFARKFDIYKDSAVLDLIDQYISSPHSPEYKVS